MRLVVAALTMVLALGSTALAQTVDLRAPDQQVAPTHQPVDPTDLRAPDQVAPAQSPLTTTDLRSPDRVAPAPPLVTTTDLRSPDQVAGPTSSVPTPVAADGGPAGIVFVLIGLAAALVLMAGGYLGVHNRHRVAIADDLVVD